jgi:hypothetical protein
MAFGGLLTGCISTLFWQSKRDLNVFSTGTEKGGFAGFSVMCLDIGIGNGARIGLIIPQNTYPHIPGVSDEG